MKKKTVIIGASPNPSRYAYLAAGMLTQYEHEIVPVGIKKGEVQGKEILDLRKKPAIEGVDTVIFNPGTENDDFEKRASDQGIDTLEACTLVMLRSGQY